jgi:hypothetical protein
VVEQTSEDGDTYSVALSTPRSRTVSEYTQVWWHSSPQQPQQQPQQGSEGDAAPVLALVPYGARSTPPHRATRSFYRESYTEEDSWTFVMDAQVHPQPRTAGGSAARDERVG